MSEEKAAYNTASISSERNRLTKRLFEHVYYTMGAYSETIPAECTPQDVRAILKHLADYEDIGTLEEIMILLSSKQAWRENDKVFTKLLEHYQIDTTNKAVEISELKGQLNHVTRVLKTIQQHPHMVPSALCRLIDPVLASLSLGTEDEDAEQGREI